MNKTKYYVDIGDKFGKLTVIGVSDNTSNKKTHYICKCDCGNTKIVDKYSLIQGRTKSCGCLVYKHGGTGTHLYMIWKDMRSRCNNPNNKFYKNYDGKGITICKEWDDYTVFMAWSKNNGYSEELTIDRIDSNSNYSPNNCRLIDIATQEKNKDCNIFLEYKNKVYTLKDLAKLLNIPRNKLSDKYYNNDLAKYNITISSYNKYVEQNGNTL